MIDVDAIKARILSMMEELEMSPSAFADQANISRSALTHISSGRNKVSLDMINKVVQGFDDWNEEWILFGKGPRRKDFSENSAQSENDLFSLAEGTMNVIDKSQNPEENKDLKEKIVMIPSKHIERITVFYSDGSYEEFISKPS